MRLALLLSILGILLLAVAGITGLNGGQARAQTTTTIEVASYYFCDQSFGGSVCEKTVTAGDTVKWEFTAGPHTVTQCNDTFTACPPAGGFDSGTHSAGQEFSHTFNTPGTFAYHCDFHPGEMRGRITVLAAQATPTATPAVSPTASGAPTPTPAASPAAAPKTGGPPQGATDGLPWSAVLALGGGLLLLGSGGLIPVLLRRR